ncbi:MAG TPA: hypothetical protein VGD45_28500 [Steroidobacter sp.]|uniref:hypothetical protein n=1 Tax=Steroidobacter sp. TaxID=1978227 RepID=UPI002EDA5455
MQQPGRSLISSALALVAVSGVAPLAMAASPAASCPAGQMAATRIELEGKYNLSPAADVFNIHALLPNVGYTKRTVIVANGYYKEVSEGTIGVVKDKPPGKPFAIPGATATNMYARELPSRYTIVETPKERLVYDESGDPDQPGRRMSKSKQTTPAEERAIVDGLQAALASSADNAAILGKATYAGIPCEIRQFLMPGNSVCIAQVRGQSVTLAEDLKVPQPSHMKAKAQSDVCVSARDFEPPANVRFK